MPQEEKIEDTPVPARSPGDFRSDVEIYITGVPIDFSSENPKRIKEFGNLLTRAKADSWPVYASSPPEYFRLLTPAGWKIIEEMDLEVTQIKPTFKTRQEWLDGVVVETVRFARDTQVPVILLRPGSPRIGDTPADNIIKMFQSQRGKVEVLDAKSGPDMVGDLAEKSFGLSNLSRQHIAGVQALELKGLKDLTGELITIRSLDKIYKDGETNLFRKVVEKLIKLGMGEKQVYIKNPKSSGEKMTVMRLRSMVDEFRPEEHYTLAVLNHELSPGR